MPNSKPPGAPHLDPKMWVSRALRWFISREAGVPHLYRQLYRQNRWGKRYLRKNSLLLPLLFLPPTAIAQTPTATALAKKVDAHYNHLASLQTRYTERYRGMGLDRSLPRTKTGKLRLQDKDLEQLEHVHEAVRWVRCWRKVRQLARGLIEE